jgi:hypothetical protein
MSHRFVVTINLFFFPYNRSHIEPLGWPPLITDQRCLLPFAPVAHSRHGTGRRGYCKQGLCQLCSIGQEQ